ncbi:MAG TPA: hypothetical protein EYQ26_15970 [Rhodospirillales bacterium]|nr:hypothetical protein [Rhodospirillales bacterium]HIL74648.1 hypothetical protein [Rhodospirillales bacterium]
MSSLSFLLAFGSGFEPPEEGVSVGRLHFDGSDWLNHLIYLGTGSNDGFCDRVLGIASKNIPFNQFC